MRDDYLSSDWAAEHDRMNGSIHKLVSGFVSGLARLHARQFEAPWRRPRTTARPVTR